MRKALTLAELPAAWKALDQGEGLWLQAELRAHLNPDRMAAVAAAAADLARRLATPCPACRAPGFGPEAPVAGRPCHACGGPTALPLILRDACPACGHEGLRPLALKADPRHCPECNP
ncbi:MAG TPA: DUF6671 family protein [Holophagaceae bacterium]|nr:DUF6671 family protein [Holophagaceae bacterium]